MKSQGIANLLAQFLDEEEFLLDYKVPGEVATIEVAVDEWVMKFDGSFTASSGGIRVVLYHRGETITLSFKLEFPRSNNKVEYEAYLTRLATALKIGVQHLKVVGDFNLVVCQAKRSFSLREPALALIGRWLKGWKKNFTRSR